MVSGQNEAERRKGEAEILSKDLQQQNERIAERRHRVRGDSLLESDGILLWLAGLGSTQRCQAS